MGKKDAAILAKEYEPFSAGMRANGFSDPSIEKLWSILVPFSDYAFNKAHTAAYGIISYWTAYLKANYPAEYMAALLTTNSDDKDKTAIYLNECRKMGVRVLSPDVNESSGDYTAVGTDIRVGLAAIRGIGHGVVASLVATRTAKGKFVDFPDFLAKIDGPVCTKKVVEALIKAGAFDSVGHRRRALFAVHENAVDGYTTQKKNEALGQDSLFGGGGDDTDTGGINVTVPDLDEWDQRVLLAYEREMIGLYVSGHPLAGHAATLAAQSTATVAEIIEGAKPAGTAVTIGGLVTSIQRKITKKGDAWAILTVEDLTGSVEAMCFPNTYAGVAHMLAQDTILLFTGRVDRKDDGAVQIALSDLKEPDLNLDPRDARPVRVFASTDRITPETVTRLREVFASHKGDTVVHMVLRGGDGKQTVLRLSDDCRVTASPMLTSEIKAILGPDSLTDPDAPAPPPPPPNTAWRDRDKDRRNDDG
jgi:DNA polymerase-3 subunit alpha